MAEITAYVHVLRDLLRLDAWDLTISADGLPDTEALADTTTTPGRWHARLRFADDLFENDASDQRDAFVHELLHLTHYEATEAIRNGEYRHQIGQVVYDSLMTEFKHHVERMVDFQARLVARSCPYPPWARPLDTDPPAS